MENGFGSLLSRLGGFFIPVQGQKFVGGLLRSTLLSHAKRIPAGNRFCIAFKNQSKIHLVMSTKFLFSILLLVSSFAAKAEINRPAFAEICLACSTPDGLTVSDLTATTATLSWNAVSGANQYTLEVEDEQNGPSTFQIETNVNGTSYALTGLQSGVLYKFKVRARCGGDKSDWSDWVFFTAGGSGGGGGGGSTDCVVPTGLMVSVTNGVATFTWDVVNSAVKYAIEVEDEQNNPSNFHLEDFALTNTYVLGGLQTGVLYKFKVRAHCANGQSDWSAWVFFNGNGNGGGGNNGGGGSGNCVAPMILSAVVGGDSATLSWNLVPGATQYNIEVEDEQNNPSNFHLEVSSQDSFYVVTGLTANVLYKFKVRTPCAGGQSDWSDWLFFNGNGGTFGNGGGGVNSGNCSKPTGTQVSNITASEALLSWTAMPDVVSYTLEIERNQNGGSSWEIVQVVATNSFLLTGLDANTRYKFKVRSNCSGGGHSKWTKWKKFKTAPFFTGTPGSSNLQQVTDDREAPVSTIVAPVLTVWPNPVQTIVTVQLQNLTEASTTLRVYDVAGRQVIEQILEYDGKTWETALNFSQLSNGLYYLQAQNGASSKTVKLVVSH